MPEDPAPAARPRHPWLQHPLGMVFFAAFVLALCWQWKDGAYRSEFGGHPDEAAHAVTGMMVRDFVAEHFRGGPVTYGATYYAHYPKIGLGVWPPFFYLVQTAWTWPLGVSRLSLLVLMALLAAGGASLAYRALRAESPWLGAGAALAAVSLPLARELYGMVMVETLSACLMFGATLLWARFLEQGRARDAIWFGLLAAAAILSKGTGLDLALMAPATMVATRRWAALRRPALWGGAAITAVLAGPWTWHYRKLGQGGWLEPHPSWHFTREALPYYAGKLGSALGWPLLLLLAVGAVLLWRRPPQRPVLAWACGALVVAVMAFQGLAPVGLEARHLVPALPAAVVLAALALRPVLPWSGPLTALALWGSTALLPQPHPKRCEGFVPLANWLVEHFQPGEEAMISSDASGEGMLISEVAMRDGHRPTYVVQRASKLLAESQWSGREYRARFADEAALRAFLLAGRLRYLVLDDSVPPGKRTAHQAQIQELVSRAPESFQHVASYRIQRGPEAGVARLYTVRVPAKE